MKIYLYNRVLISTLIFIMTGLFGFCHAYPTADDLNFFPDQEESRSGPLSNFIGAVVMAGLGLLILKLAISDKYIRKFIFVIIALFVGFFLIYRFVNQGWALFYCVGICIWFTSQNRTRPDEHISEKKTDTASPDKPLIKSGGTAISPANLKDTTVRTPKLNVPAKKYVPHVWHAETTPALQANSLKNAGANDLSTESDLNYLSLNENLKNPNVLSSAPIIQPSYRIFKSVSDYSNYRVDAEVRFLCKRDSPLWDGCWIATKNLDSRIRLYKKIRIVQIVNHLKPLFITLTLQSLDDAVNAMDNMSSAEVEKAITAIQPNSAAL